MSELSGFQQNQEALRKACRILVVEYGRLVDEASDAFDENQWERHHRLSDLYVRVGDAIKVLKMAAETFDLSNEAVE